MINHRFLTSIKTHYRRVIRHAESPARRLYLLADTL